MAEAATATKANTDVDFKIEFEGDKKPNLDYDKAQDQFSLQNGPLAVGSLEQLGTSVAEFFGGHFPDTGGIPVIGPLMNKLQFNIQKFQYTGESATKTSAFDLEIDAIPTKDSMKIGTAVVTDIDISISRQAKSK